MRSYVILSTTLLLAIAPAVANADTTYIGGDGGNWHSVASWNNGVPTASDVVTINNNHYPDIDDSATAYAKSLNIDNANSGVRILTGATLVLGDGSARTSNLDNASNEVTVRGTLQISGEHTFTGNGTIRLKNNATSLIVEATDGDDLLILETDCGASPLDQACSMTLAGEGEVAVALDNRAYVIADSDELPSTEIALHLTTRPKTTDAESDAFWIAENGGNLFVETLVTGPGEWQVKDVDCTDDCDTRGTGCNGLIKVVAETDGCVVGTGNVILEAGCQGDVGAHALKVEGNVFCTTGRLTWRSVNVEPDDELSTPGIRVSADAAAKFGLSEACDAVNDCS